MSRKKTAIIIVTFNSEKYIAGCIKSVLKQFPIGISKEIVVIDNCSNDKTLTALGEFKKNKEVRVITNDENFGFAKAVNQGLREAKDADYFLLLNPDTLVGKTSIGTLISCMEKSKAGIVGGSTFGLSGLENGSYFRFPNLMVGLFDFTNLRKLSKDDYWHKYFYYKDVSLKNEECYPVDVVTGGYMLIKRNTVNKIGFLDEKFFMYLEDVDYCLRAKNNGIKVYHSNAASIIHYSGKSSKNKEGVRHASWLKSRKIYFFKHFGILINIIIQPVFLLDDIVILSKLYLTR